MEDDLTIYQQTDVRFSSNQMNFVQNESIISDINLITDRKSRGLNTDPDKPLEIKPPLSSCSTKEAIMVENIHHKFFKVCERGDVEGVLSMLNTNICKDRRPDINHKYLHDYTVLHTAINNSKCLHNLDNFDLVLILIGYGAHLEASTSMGRRCIHFAVIKGYLDILDYLISCGANINVVDNEKNTVLHFASRLGYLEILDYLLLKNSDVSIRNLNNETPLDIMANIQVYNIFLKHLSLSGIEKYKSGYSRSVVHNFVFHNNMSDNIRKLLYKAEAITQKLIEESVSGPDSFNNKDGVNIESFKILEMLGKGSFGEVYLVEFIQTSKLYAMKVLSKSKLQSQNIVNYVVTERNVLSTVKHPFIVNLYFAFQTEDFLYLILDCCRGKDLNYHLNKRKCFNQTEVRLITAQLILAIEELHKRDIIYRDLKPENVVIDEEGFIKLTDFGLSKVGIKDNKSAKSFCGSLAYMAPEVLTRQGHGKAVDWYLFGVLIYELIFGVPPFYTTSSKEALFYNIKNAKLDFPEETSDDLRDLITKLMNRDPNKRLGAGHQGAGALKAHPFYADINFVKIYKKQFEPPAISTISKDEERLARMKTGNYVCNGNIAEITKADTKTEESNIEGWTFIGTNKSKRFEKLHIKY